MLEIRTADYKKLHCSVDNGRYLIKCTNVESITMKVKKILINAEMPMGIEKEMISIIKSFIPEWNCKRQGRITNNEG